MAQKKGVISLNFWEELSVYITGINGFVGSHLASKLLKLGSKVVGLIEKGDDICPILEANKNENLELVFGDLTDYKLHLKLFKFFKFQSVFHQAAETQVMSSYENPLKTFETNIRGTYLLLDVCKHHKGRLDHILVASSDKAYGTSDNLPYTETHRLEGAFPYDVSKSCTDLIARSYADTYHLPIGITRSANIYGPGDHNFDRLIPGTIRSLLSDQRPILRSCGKGIRNYVYIEDVIDGYLCLASKLQAAKWFGEAFNFSSEDCFDALQVVAKIGKVLGKESLIPIVKNISQGEILDQQLSFMKAQEKLQWLPKVTFSKGIEEATNYYMNFFHQESLV